MLRITDAIVIADWEITESFSRASGPGGQNVNKVSTAVELRFEAERSPHLSPAVKARLKRLAGRRWTLDGAIVIRAEETRSQARNRELARERLAELIRAALVAPKRRIATKPTAGSQRRRLAAKSVRGEVKSLRGKVSDDQQSWPWRRSSRDCEQYSAQRRPDASVAPSVCVFHHDIPAIPAGPSGLYQVQACAMRRTTRKVPASGCGQDGHPC